MSRQLVSLRTLQKQHLSNECVVFLLIVSFPTKQAIYISLYLKYCFTDGWVFSKPLVGMQTDFGESKVHLALDLNPVCYLGMVSCSVTYSCVNIRVAILR